MNLWEEPVGGARGRGLWEEPRERPVGGHSHSNLDSDLRKSRQGIHLPVYQKRLLELLSGVSGLHPRHCHHWGGVGTETMHNRWIRMVQRAREGIMTQWRLWELNPDGWLVFARHEAGELLRSTGKVVAFLYSSKEYWNVLRPGTRLITLNSNGLKSV